MMRPESAVGADGLSSAERDRLREARRHVAALNALLARRRAGRQYAVLIAGAQRSGLFVEPEPAEAGEVA